MAGPALAAQVSTDGIPETAATRAASILVTIPPVPTFDPVPPTCTFSKAASTFGTYAMRLDSGSLGGAVYSASTSVSSTKASATTILAINADSRSLSPKRISLEARESFSLMIGTAPRSSSRSSVRRTLRYCCGAIVSETVMRICPTRKPYRAKAASYCAISSPCPTAAQACWSATSVGRAPAHQPHPCQSRHQSVQPFRIEVATRLGQRTGAHFHHDGLRLSDGPAHLCLRWRVHMSLPVYAYRSFEYHWHTTEKPADVLLSAHQRAWYGLYSFTSSVSADSPRPNRLFSSWRSSSTEGSAQWPAARSAIMASRTA